MTIQILPPHVARLIAAGEVVSRPLDVVRELIENALDAGATRIEIELEKGGLGLVSVKDNGVGIPASSVALAPVRHATSKLQPNITAVEKVSSLGFRGEALWAAAQAGEVHLITRPAQQLGASEVWAQGDEIKLGKTSAPAGSRVSVRHLFAHLPARLRTQAPALTEIREITALVSRYVLHHPQLYWRLSVETEPRLTHAPADHRSAVVNIYGALSGNRLLKVEAEGILGVTSRPELTRVRRDRMHFSINSRPILAPPELEKAVIDAYAELLPSGSAPLCVIDITVAPEDHNPNIHPAKQMVALADLAGVANRLKTAIASSLAAQPLARPMPLPTAPSTTASASPNTSNTFPQLKVLGVYQELYLLAQAEGDLWIVDAHAAHERALYEQLAHDLHSAPPLELPEPELLHLNPEQLARLHERGAEFKTWGLVIEDFGAGLARLRALPAVWATLPIPKLHSQIIEAALGDHPDPQREVLGRLACAPALKAGMLTQQLGEQVLIALMACQQPWTCPHGRPTTLRLSERDLAHAFGRRSPRDIARGRDETKI